MAWGFVADRGTAASIAAGTTIAVSPSAEIAVGAIAVVAVVSDNLNTTDADHAEHTLADTDGHVWTKLRRYTNGEGAAKAGVTVSLWATKVTSAIGVADSITATVGGDSYARAIRVGEFSVAAGGGFSIESGIEGVADAATSGPSKALSSLAEQEYLFLGFDGGENTTDAPPTQDADYATVGAAFGDTPGGAPSGHVVGMLGYRIATLTGDTHAETASTNRDWAGVFVALKETVTPKGFPFFDRARSFWHPHFTSNE